MIDTSKIIRASINGSKYTETAPLWKEHYGIYLKIEGADLPETYEVDFSNDEFNGSSVTMIGNADGVLIPRQFIDTGKDVFAFLYWVGEDYGKTVYKFKIPNRFRPDRTDEQPTPEEQSVIDQAIAALNNAVEQTAQDVINADASAQSASDSADRAEIAEQDAENAADVAHEYADSASASANSANQSATASAQSASASAQSASEATQAKQDAQGYANSASQSATNAQTYALSANAASGTAENFADVASGYATSAQTSAQTASSKATEASGYANTSSQKASESAQSASSALGYKTDAESAKTDAQTAQGLAESARDLAQGYASDARGYANDAQASAESISASASQIAKNTADILKAFPTDTASGAIASFPDGADNIPLKSLVVNIDPVQDLHGYDSPWVGGGGKNLLSIDTSGSGNYTITSTGEYTQDPTRLSSDYIPCVSGEAYVVSGIVGANTKSNVFSFAGIAFYDANKTFLERVAVNNVNTLTATAPQNAVFMRFFEEASKAASELGGTLTTAYYDTYKRQVEKGSTATAYAPYENICPISGWTGMNLRHTNENLWDDAWYTLDNVMSLITDTSSSFYGYYNGSIASWASAERSHRIQYVFPKGVDSLSVTADYGNKSSSSSFIFRVYFYYADGTSSYNSNINVDAGSKTTATRVSTSGKKCTGFVISTSAGTGNLQGCIKNVRASFGDSTEYVEPVANPLIPISWQSEAGTVYGGQLNVLSGVLTVEKAQIDLATLTGWVNNMTGQNAIEIRCSLTGKKAGRTNLISNMLKTGTETSATNTAVFSVRGFPTSSVIAVKVPKTVFQNSSEVVTWISNNHPMLCYELAEPIIIQLTPHEVNSLLGQNNIWADTGDTSCEYRADTRLYIEKLTQPTEDDMVANSAITSGQFFMIGNSLYKALTAIASGATITVGTNAQRVSLADALNLINT